MSATKFDFKQEIKELGKNKNFFWISVCFMLMYGLYTTIGAIINTMVSPYGYTGSDSGIFGACFILCGLVGSFMQGALLDKYGKYLLLLKGICFGVFFFFLGFCLLLHAAFEYCEVNDTSGSVRPSRSLALFTSLEV